MLTVALSADDFAKDGQYVRLGRVVSAIVRAYDSSDQLNAERDAIQIVNAGVQLKLLNPRDPGRPRNLPRGDWGNGIVPLAELVEWGRSTKQFDFRIPECEAWREAGGKDGRGRGCEMITDETTAPDWQFWQHMPEVKLWQAIALSLNENPDRLIYSKGRIVSGETVDEFFSENREATKRLRLLTANHYDRRHFSACTLNMGDPRLSGVRLPEFAAWALSVMEWDGLPPKLVAMAQKREVLTPEPSTPAEVGAGDTAADAKIVRIKRAALITKYQREWPAIEDDLRHSNENGLRDAAKLPNEHGYWNETAAVQWAEERGKLPTKQKPEAPRLDNLTAWALRK